MSEHTSQKPIIKNCGVVGNPISHSKSPLIHNFFIKKYGIQAEYTPIHIKSQSELELLLQKCRGNQWVGLNITIPYKETVIPYLDEWDDNVKIMGACNTIVNKNGRLYGFNTDAEGFMFPLKTLGDSVLIFGNGGAAKAVIFQCAKERVKKITVLARSPEKSMAYIQQLNQTFGTQIQVEPIHSFESRRVIEYDLVVNATQIGMKASDPVFEPIQSMQKNQTFYDLIYTPWETKMMAIARKNQANVLNGAWMLAGQGALAFYHFFNQVADVNQMFKLIKGSLN